jgi:hypothetical protein
VSPGPRDLTAMRAEVEQRAERIRRRQRRTRHLAGSAAAVVLLAGGAVGVQLARPGRVAVVSTDGPTAEAGTTSPLLPPTSPPMVTVQVPPPAVREDPIAPSGVLGPDGQLIEQWPTVLDVPDGLGGIRLEAGGRLSPSGLPEICIRLDADGPPSQCTSWQSGEPSLLAFSAAEHRIYAAIVPEHVLSVSARVGDVHIGPLTVGPLLQAVGGLRLSALRLPPDAAGSFRFHYRGLVLDLPFGAEGIGTPIAREDLLSIVGTAVRYDATKYLAVRARSESSVGFSEGYGESVDVDGRVVHGGSFPSAEHLVAPLVGLRVWPGASGIYHFFPVPDADDTVTVARTIGDVMATTTIEAGAPFDVGDGAFLIGYRMSGWDFEFDWEGRNPLSLTYLDPEGATVRLSDGTNTCTAELRSIDDPFRIRFGATCDTFLTGRVVTVSGTVDGKPLRGIVLS